MRAPNVVPLAGYTLGRLTVVGYSHSDDGNSFWRCLCSCGTYTIVRRDHLLSGRSKSCGCLRRENTTARKTTHGATAKREFTRSYISWSAMWYRCTNPSCKSFKNYGGRGITICDRWKTYENFAADMGERPRGLTLERINNEAGYSPENCKWATHREQRLNQRPRKARRHD